MTASDKTLDPAATSWVGSAGGDATDFPIQNLPLGVFDDGTGGRIAVAIGEEMLDLRATANGGMLNSLPAEVAKACRSHRLNELMALGAPAAAALRHAVFAILDAGARGSVRTSARRCLVPASSATMIVPAEIGDYTDFYASIDHASNVGAMFRPDNPLLPNYKYVPIGYHGRASSIVPSGTPVRRPTGQSKPPQAETPVFGPSRSLDYEAEIGFYVGVGNELGAPVPIGAARERLFGFSIVNDWSARDIQAWEYQPLGPFLSKNFATTVSPWVVTSDALAPFRVPRAPRGDGDPRPLPYLDDPEDARSGAFAIEIEVLLSTRRMRESGAAPVRLSRADFARMYWTPAQMLAHHASGGCNLRPGDLLASGTVSGPTRDERGCLLELTSRGAEPLELPGGERRAFLEDGDEVIMRARCERDGFASIGFGECRGEVRQ